MPDLQGLFQSIYDETNHALRFTSGSYVPLNRPVNVVAASGAGTVDLSTSTAEHHVVTLTGNCGFTFPAVSAASFAKEFTLKLIQDATGSRVPSWPAGTKWANHGIAETLTTTAAGVDVLTFLSMNGSNWTGYRAGSDEK